jgi:hypothetical protein
MGAGVLSTGHLYIQFRSPDSAPLGQSEAAAEAHGPVIALYGKRGAGGVHCSLWHWPLAAATVNHAPRSPNPSGIAKNDTLWQIFSVTLKPNLGCDITTPFVPGFRPMPRT